MPKYRELSMLIIAVSMAWALDLYWVDDPRYLVVMSAVPNCSDARANGMGMVVTAGELSACAIFSNPSAIALGDKTSITLNSRTYGGFIKDDFQKTVVYDEYHAYLTPHAKVTNLGASTVLSFSENPFTIGLGVGYHTPYDLGHNIYARLKRGDNTIECSYKYSGGFNAIAPALAVGFFKKYSVGIAFHKSLPFLETLSYDAVEKGGNEARYQYEATGSAYYTTIGVTAKPVSPLEVGLAFSSPIVWKFSSEKTEIDGRTVNEANTNVDAPIPWLLALAGRYRILEKLYTALELQTRMLNDLDRGEYADSYSAGVAARLGAEYLLGQVPLRAGIFVESVPYAGIDSIADPSLPALQIGATAGMSLSLKKAIVDAALQWSRTSVKQDDGSDQDDQYMHVKNVFRIDVGFRFELPGISISPKYTVVPDSLTPQPMEEPGRRRPHY